MRASKLQWLPDHGIGFHKPVREFYYDQAYFQHFVDLADTPMAKALNQARVAMLLRHAKPTDMVVDIGIGAGTFIETVDKGRVYGYDVNPHAIAWLKERKLFFNPYDETTFDVACFWDSLEHIAYPTALLENVRSVVLVSLPIFRDAWHARTSKHYKPNEHVWYFTDEGIRWFMGLHHFDCVEANAVESHIGREDVFSYAFKRREL